MREQVRSREEESSKHYCSHVLPFGIVHLRPRECPREASSFFGSKDNPLAILLAKDEVECSSFLLV